LRLALAIGVLLAGLGSALVGVCEQSENRRLEYRVWDAMRRRDHLNRQIREIEAQLDEALSARRLLEARDGAVSTLPDEEDGR
jgi:hypothetical protein